MKKSLLFLAAALAFLISPLCASAAYSDSVDLTVIVLNQDKTLGESLSVRMSQNEDAEDSIDKNLNELCAAVFKGAPIEQFTLQAMGEDGTEGPKIAVSLFRGDKTEVLSGGEVTDISVDRDLESLSLGLLITNTGELQLYNAAEETADVFSVRSRDPGSMDTGKVDVKFNLKDAVGDAINVVSLQVDERDVLPVNGDGEVYVAALAAGTHSLTAYSSSGAQIAASHLTLSPGSDTGLAAQNPSNPTVSVESGLEKVYVQADISGDLVKIDRVSPLPITPGAKPLEVVFAIKGRLLDGDSAPMPSVKVSLGDYSATTDNSGFFWLNALPADKYKVNVEDADGETIASSILLVEKNDTTGIRDVSLDSATLAVNVYAGTVYLSMRLDGDKALTVTDASEKNIFAAAPSSASPSALRSAAPAASSKGSLASSASSRSYLSIYLYLFLFILVLIILVVTLILRAAFPRKKTKH